MIDQDSLEILRQASPERVYALLMRLCTEHHPTFQAEFEHAIRKGIPMATLRTQIEACFEPELVDIFAAAVRWKRNMLIVSDVDDFRFRPAVPPPEC